MNTTKFNHQRTEIQRDALGAFLMTPICILAFIVGWNLADLLL